MPQQAASAAPQTDPVMAELLQSVVDVARAIFGAAASSILLLDEEADELIFHAVSGEGQEFLVGRRFPAGQGIAGWVVGSGEPMVVDDLRSNASFDRSVAEATQYVPDALMAAPLVHGNRVLGVLEVLDPAPQARASLPELDLLFLFARQAATALQIAVDSRAGGGPGNGHGPTTAQRAAAVGLLTEARRLLQDAGGDW